MRELDSNSQTKFLSIKEYKKKIEKRITKCSHVFGLKEKKKSIKFEEIIIKKLGDFTHLELTNFNLTNNSVSDSFKHLLILECELVAKMPKEKYVN